jgi:hypothetical protein
LDPENSLFSCQLQLKMAKTQSQIALVNAPLPEAIKQSENKVFFTDDTYMAN